MSRIWGEKQVLAELERLLCRKLSRSWLHRWVRNDDQPLPMHTAGGRAYADSSELSKWVNSWLVKQREAV
jgi:hypothetical protein